MYSLSIPEFLCVYSAAFRDDNKSSDATSSNGTNIEGTLKDYTLVKSIKNSLGFYKINGTLENQGAIIHSDIEDIKYYKIPSVNDTTLICYKENRISCEYEPTIQIHPKSFFLAIPDANNKSKL